MAPPYPLTLRAPRQSRSPPRYSDKPPSLTRIELFVLRRPQRGVVFLRRYVLAPDFRLPRPASGLLVQIGSTLRIVRMQPPSHSALRAAELSENRRAPTDQSASSTPILTQHECAPSVFPPRPDSPDGRGEAPGFRAIDRRTSGACAVMAFRRDLASALGGEDHLSPQRRKLIDMAARAALFLDHLDGWLTEQISLINAGPARCSPRSSSASRSPTTSPGCSTSWGSTAKREPIAR